MGQLVAQNTIHYKGSRIGVSKGVVQGGILSSILFNYYLDRALHSSQHLSDLITHGKLVALTDDILIRAQGEKENEAAINALESLQGTYGLEIIRVTRCSSQRTRP
jgi:hypothetical protein